MPVLPTARREFAATDRVLAFLRVYQGARRAAPGHAADDGPERARPGHRVRLVDDRRGDVRERPFGEQFISVPVTSLAAGDYLLRIEASAGEY